MPVRPPASRGTALAVGAAIALAAACSRPAGPTAGPASPSPSPSAVATTAPPPPARGRAAVTDVSPLTGQCNGAGRPVVAVKVDNTRHSHPHVGVGEADIVYMEPVEGFVTRLVAVYSSRLPAIVGPVRSARESDLHLLRQYGRVVLAYAGANSGLTRQIRAAPVLDVSFLVVPGAYFRGYGRRAPYSTFVRLPAILAARPGTAKVRDVGFRFAAATPPGGAASGGFSVRYGPLARVAFRYDAGTRRWPLAMDGRPATLVGGGVIAPTNVLVQYVVVRGSRYADVLGYVSPYVATVGSGAAVLFRDGRRYVGRWARPRPSLGTRFVDRAGRDLLLRPGSTWVLLVPTGRPLQSP